MKKRFQQPSASSKKPTRKPKISDMITLPGKRKAIYQKGEDSAGEISKYFRIVDTLGVMLRKGTITEGMYDAAVLFGGDFHFAGLLGMKNLNYTSTGGTSASGSATEKAAFAAHRVRKALASVGGIDSLSGSFLWQVVGEGMQIGEWASSTRWNNRSLTKDEARGIAIGALQILAHHYGYQPGPRTVGSSIRKTPVIF